MSNGTFGTVWFHMQLATFGEGHFRERAALADYHFSITVHGEFDDAVNKTRDALSDHGFGIVSEIDMAATLKEKLDVDIPPYLILGACKPSAARDVVAVEPAIGTLLPCNVVVRAVEGDGVMVDFMDPAVIVELVGENRVREIADEVRTALEMTRDAIATA